MESALNSEFYYTWVNICLNFCGISICFIFALSQLVIDKYGKYLIFDFTSVNMKMYYCKWRREFMAGTFVALIVGIILFLLGLLGSQGEGHGIINTPGAYQYPVLGRKASMLFGIIQGCFIIPMILIFLFLRDYWILSVICIIIPIIVGITYCEVICKKRFIKDNKSQKAQTVDKADY